MIAANSCARSSLCSRPLPPKCRIGRTKRVMTSGLQSWNFSLMQLMSCLLCTKETIAGPPAFHGLLAKREYSAYKNQFGRIGVVAGSKGFIGAALMTSEGALRAGAGLVEVFVPEEIYEIVASAAPMGAMVKPIKSYRALLRQKTDVWELGPGLGKLHAN